MKEYNPLVIKKQIFGINQFEKVCFCKLKNVYDSNFTISNTAECIGPHTMQCLIINIKGNGSIIYRNHTKVQLTPNTIFFGSMKDMLEIKSASQHWRFLCYWYFIDNSEQEISGTYSNINFDIEKEIADANNFIRLLQSHSYSKSSIASAMFTNKLLTLIDTLEISTKSQNNLFEKMLVYVNTHIREKLTTRNIAEEFNYCEKHIRYLFNKHLKTTPSKFIDDLKLEHILTLLQSSAYSLEELAEIFHYSSASHLISRFKKKYKYSPKKYLKRLKVRQNHAKLKGV